MLPINCRSQLDATGFVVLLLSITVVISSCVRSPVDPVVVELRWAYLDSCVANKKDPGLHRAYRTKNRRLFRGWYCFASSDTSHRWHAASGLLDSAEHWAKDTAYDDGTRQTEETQFNLLWETLFIDGFRYHWDDTVLTAPQKRNAIRFEGRRCFWRIAPADLDTVTDYVRARTHVLGLAVEGDPPYHQHVLKLVEASGADMLPDTVGQTKQLKWLNKHGDHVTSYFHGLELSVHAFVVRKEAQDSTCLVQQIQLVELYTCKKPGCHGAEP